MLDTPPSSSGSGSGSSSGALSLPELAGVLDWWREAGVDCSFADAAEGWLEMPDEVVEAAPPPPVQAKAPRRTTPLQRALDGTKRTAIGAERAAWPQDLAGFREFWLTEPSLAEGTLSTRVAPRGTRGSKLMVLVPQPEEADRDRLLSGELGAMMDGFLRATGIAQDRVYVASALPRSLPLPDWADLAARGLADLTRHHIALAGPARILAFGRGLLPLFTQNEAPPPILDLPDGAIPLMLAPRLDRLARMPGHRKHFWTQWLEWTA